MKTIIYNNILAVPKADWDTLQQGHSCTYSYQFWAILERAQLNDFSYQYAIFYDDNDHPVALTSFYAITTDIAIFATGLLKTAVAKIRTIFPNFFQFKMLECGTPITLNKPFITNNINEADIVTALNDMLMNLAKKEGYFLIVVRDFESETSAIQPQFKQLGYHLVDSLPTTYMDINWRTPATYLAAMKSYYRSKLNKHLRINEKQGICHELCDDFAHLADTLCKQWLVVHNHASEYQREILTPEFYRGFSQDLGANSKVILFYRHDTLIGHALLLMDGDLLRWLYFGRTDAVNDSLYIYVAHKVVETAINLGAKKLELGLTTYPIKKDLGAYMSPLKLALRAPSPLINPYVGWFYPLLNQTPAINNKSIFKD
jgi:predicted N-acyltransferase